MKTFHVEFTVKQEYADAFMRATAMNATNSRKEPGVDSFRLFQAPQSAATFILLERYQTAEDQLLHRETAHYRTWKKEIAKYLEKPYAVLELVELE